MTTNLLSNSAEARPREVGLGFTVSSDDTARLAQAQANSCVEKRSKTIGLGKVVTLVTLDDKSQFDAQLHKMMQAPPEPNKEMAGTNDERVT